MCKQVKWGGGVLSRCMQQWFVLHHSSAGREKREKQKLLVCAAAWKTRPDKLGIIVCSAVHHLRATTNAAKEIKDVDCFLLGLKSISPLNSGWLSSGLKTHCPSFSCNTDILCFSHTTAWWRIVPVYWKQPDLGNVTMLHYITWSSSADGVCFVIIELKIFKSPFFPTTLKPTWAGSPSCALKKEEERIEHL